MSRETRERSDRYELVVFEDYEYQGQRRSCAFPVGGAVKTARLRPLHLSRHLAHRPGAGGAGEDPARRGRRARGLSIRR